MVTQSNEQADAWCATCGDPFPLARRNLGYRHCLTCGDKLAHQRRFTTAPLNKSNYVLISDPADLCRLNPKR